MNNEMIMLDKLEYTSDRQRLLAQIDRATLRISQDEEKILEISRERNELIKLLDECFESGIAALGAGENLKPHAGSQELANRVWNAIKTGGHKTGN